MGPISDWGFSKDAGDECYSPKGDKSEGDYELQGDDVTAQSKDKMKKRKKKQRASEVLFFAYTVLIHLFTNMVVVGRG